MATATDGGEMQASSVPDLLISQLLPPFNHAVNQATGGGVRRRTFKTRFLPEHVFEHYARQTQTALTSLPPGHMRYRELPSEFINILPLDKSILDEDTGAGGAVAQTTGSFLGPQSTAGLAVGCPSHADQRPRSPAASTSAGAFGYVSSIYKGISSEDGFTYTIRRVDGCRSNQAIMDQVVAAWARAAHPSVIALRRAQPASSARGGPATNALFFLHDYYPGARSLRELYLDSRGPAIPEPTLWSYICQMVAGIRAVHDAGLSFRGIRASHVLVTGQARVRLGGAGVFDVLEADSPKNIESMKAADMLSLGQLILQLAVRSPVAHTGANATTSLDTVKQIYSPALHALIIVLVAKPLPVHDVCRLLAPQMLAELDSAYDHADALDSLLAREADNGRLLRLLLKLGYINERPDHEGDASWAETGERYLLKLFRDFLFHQVSEDGRPVLDVAHAIDALNHLDIGSPSRVLLSSRDGASILVSSYASLRNAVHSSFDELRQAARARDNDSSAAAAAEAETSGGGGVGDDWLRRPRVPAVVRARSGAAMRGRGGRGGVGARGGMGMNMGMGMGMGAGGGGGLPFGMHPGLAGMGMGSLSSMMGSMAMAAAAGMQGFDAGAGAGDGTALGYSHTGDSGDPDGNNNVGGGGVDEMGQPLYDDGSGGGALDGQQQEHMMPYAEGQERYGGGDDGGGAGGDAYAPVDDAGPGQGGDQEQHHGADGGSGSMMYHEYHPSAPQQQQQQHMDGYGGQQVDEHGNPVHSPAAAPGMIASAAEFVPSFGDGGGGGGAGDQQYAPGYDHQTGQYQQYDEHGQLMGGGGAGTEAAPWHQQDHQQHQQQPDQHQGGDADAAAAAAAAQAASFNVFAQEFRPTWAT